MHDNGNAFVQTSNQAQENKSKRMNKRNIHEVNRNSTNTLTLRLLLRSAGREEAKSNHSCCGEEEEKEEEAHEEKQKRQIKKKTRATTRQHDRKSKEWNMRKKDAKRKAGKENCEENVFQRVISQ